jgi:predicted nucleic acid-binding protein
MAFLLDTNVLLELRKGQRSEARVRSWFNSVSTEELYISVIALGEIRRGIEKVRPRDAAFAARLDAWLRTLQAEYRDRILPITQEIAEFWGRISPSDPLPEPDGLIVATAMYHDLTLVTRNLEHFGRSGATILDPWGMS